LAVSFVRKGFQADNLPFSPPFPGHFCPKAKIRAWLHAPKGPSCSDFNRLACVSSLFTPILRLSSWHVKSGSGFWIVDLGFWIDRPTSWPPTSEIRPLKSAIYPKKPEHGGG